MAASWRLQIERSRMGAGMVAPSAMIRSLYTPRNNQGPPPLTGALPVGAWLYGSSYWT
jgi:hypothetical protein